jgi:HSP20 family protein
MMLRRLDPVSEFDRMSRALDSLFASSPVSPTAPGVPLDIVETPDALTIRASLPGIHPDHVDLTLEENVLTLRAESRKEPLVEGTKIYRQEIPRGTFTRSVRLPEGLDLDSVRADFDLGLLTIQIAKQPEPEPKVRKIAVRVGSNEPVLEAESSDALGEETPQAE